MFPFECEFHRFVRSSHNRSLLTTVFTNKRYAPPYELMLTFGHCIVEDGSERATYDLDRGILVVRLPKANHGQVFADLDSVKPQQHNDGQEQEQQGEEEEQQGVMYGFNGQYCGVFKGLEKLDVDLLELPDPETTPPEQRTALRILAENVKFDPSYYQAEYAGQDVWDHVLKFEPWWLRFAQHVLPPMRVSEVGASVDAPAVPFTEQDHMVLARLTAKNMLLDDRRAILCGLVDILYAYAYQHCTMLGEESCEASWTICRLSRLLSWLDCAESDLHSTLVQSYRRALAYPLYRSWKICEFIKTQVQLILFGGKFVLLKCLLDTYHSLTHNQDKRYLLNVVFVSDYLLFVQMEPEVVFTGLADSLARLQVTKESTQWPLIELEQETERIPMATDD